MESSSIVVGVDIATRVFQQGRTAARARRVRGEHAGGRRAASRGLPREGPSVPLVLGWRWPRLRAAGAPVAGRPTLQVPRRTESAQPVRAAGGPARAGAVSGRVELCPDAVELQQLAEASSVMSDGQPQGTAMAGSRLVQPHSTIRAG